MLSDFLLCKGVSTQPVWPQLPATPILARHDGQYHFNFELENIRPRLRCLFQVFGHCGEESSERIHPIVLPSAAIHISTGLRTTLLALGGGIGERFRMQTSQTLNAALKYHTRSGLAISHVLVWLELSHSSRYCRHPATN